jgi:divalent metal cation (Fe/Co/Zn/Cd) transporter
MNFWTVLEWLLNKKLSTDSLDILINESWFSQDIKNKMNDIKNLRNRVHPNRIADNWEITKEEALKVKNYLEIILFEFYKLLFPL